MQEVCEWQKNDMNVGQLVVLLGLRRTKCQSWKVVTLEI